MHCNYCDELHKVGTEMTQAQVLERILELDRAEGPHTFISLTGGEPLLYLVFLKPLIEQLKLRGYRIYLETSGVLWNSLRDVLSLCDVIAMDMKPASVTGEKNFDQDHRKFLKLAAARETFVKIVVSKAIDPEEFLAEVKLIAEIAPEMPLILQPLSADKEGHEDPVLMNLLSDLQRLASQSLKDVRIVPRLHRILQIK